MVTKLLSVIVFMLLTACVSHKNVALSPCASLSSLDAIPEGIQTCRKAYSVGHNADTGRIAWVHYRLTTDSSVVSPSIYPLDVDAAESPSRHLPVEFDWAQLVPSNLNAYDRQAFEESRESLIAIPMHKHLHRYMEFYGDWAVTSRWEASYGIRKPDTDVFSGPIYENGDVIPSHFYKVYYDRKTPAMMAMIFENNGEIDDAHLAHNVVTVDCVEERTGLNFFAGVPDENDLENDNAITVRYWNMIDGNSRRYGCK